MTTAGADIVSDAPATASAKARPERPNLPVSSTAAVLVLTFWSVDIISPALPEMQADLALTATGAGLVYSLLFTGRLLGNFPAPALLERFGVAVSVMIGGLLLVVGSSLVAIAPGLVLVLAGRAVQGLGIAFLINAALRSLIAAKPGRGAAMTFFGVAATCGGMLGLQTGGIITEQAGWRWVFALSIALGLLVIVVSLVSAGLGRAQRAARSDPSAPEAEPAPPPAEVSRRLLAGGLLINFAVCVNYSIWVVLPLYMERTFSVSPQLNANLLLVITIMHIVGAFPAGWAMRRFGSVPTLFVGMMIAVAGGLLILPIGTPYLVALPLVLYGGGMVAAGNAAGDIILHMGRGGSRAVRQVRISGDMGLVVGPFVAGRIADIFGYGAPLVAMSLLTAVAAIALLIKRSAFAAHG